MNSRMIATMWLASLFWFTTLYGQHSDVEFGYDSLASPSAFVIEGNSLTTDGIQYWESEFIEDALQPGDFFADEPGFATNATENLFINAGDRISLRVLNAQGNSATGVGFINYFNPSTGLLQASSTHRILAEQNSVALPDLVFNGGGIESAPNSNPVFLGTGSSSNGLHDHIFFDLLDEANAPLGAYGVLFQLESDFALNGFGSTDLTSDRFWVIWNRGMDPTDFERQALPAFGAIPEPGSFALLSLSAVGFAIRRRRASIVPAAE